MAVNVTKVDIQADTAGNRIPVGGYPGRRRVLGLVTVSGKVRTGVALGGAGNRVDAVTKGTSHHPGRGEGVANIATAQRVRPGRAGGSVSHTAASYSLGVGGVDLSDLGLGGGLVLRNLI